MPLKVLCVAEKPSVARAMVDILVQCGGQRTNLQTKSQFHPVVEIKMDRLRGIQTTGQITLLITSVTGHVFSNDFSKDEYGWDRCDPSDLFFAPILHQASKGTEALVTNLSHFSNSIDQLWLWLDCDREGESIADEVRTIVQNAVKPRSVIVKRAKFNALTQEQVLGAIATLGQVDELAVKAANTRAEIDLRLGAIFTRFQTRLVSGGGILSYGGCQIPTLKLVVQRYLEHYCFRPCSFWYLQCFIKNEQNSDLSDNVSHDNDDNIDEEADLDSIRHYRSSINGFNNNRTTNTNTLPADGIIFRWSRPNFFERDALEMIHASLHELKPQQHKDHLLYIQRYLNNPTELSLPSPIPPISSSPHLYKPRQLTVVSCTEKRTSKYRPIPLTTVEMQKFSCRKLGMTSQEAMDLAESLYQEGFISYPRTETESFPSDMELQLKEVINLFATQQSYQGNINNNTHDLEDYRVYCQKLIIPNRSYIPQGNNEDYIGDSNEENNFDYHQNAHENQPTTQLTMTSKYRFPRAGKKNDQAHPPIHPKKVRSPHEWANSSDCLQKRKIYDYITRHFFACCSLDAFGKKTTAVLQDTVTLETFNGDALTVHERNFLEIVPWERWSDKTLPPLTPGTTIQPTMIQIKQGATTGPQLHTESSLLAEMDKNGIGTDATMASHITTLRNRGYFFPNSVLPTPLGCALVLGWAFRCPLLVSVSIRRELEDSLGAIATGRKQATDVIKQQIDIFRDIYTSMEHNRNHRHEFAEVMKLALSNEVQLDVMAQLASKGDNNINHLGGFRNNNNNNNSSRPPSVSAARNVRDGRNSTRGGRNRRGSED